MTTLPSNGCRKRERPCIVTVVLSLSLLATGMAKIPQHRVKRGIRTVRYNRNTSLRHAGSRFWMPDSAMSQWHDSGFEPSELDRTQPTPKESTSLWLNEHDATWHFHVDAGVVLQNRHQRRLTGSVGIYKGQQMQQLDEDPYQDSIVGNYDNETYNVSTAVKFGVRDNTTNSSYIYSTSVSNATLTSPFQPMRIRVILSENQTGTQRLTKRERLALFGDILSPAILAWSAALRVNPVVGNLTVDSSQLSDGVSCGPGIHSGHPSVLVPSDHITIGLNNTDFVVYLSLSIHRPLENETADVPTTSPTAAPSASPFAFANWTRERTLSAGESPSAGYHGAFLPVTTEKGTNGTSLLNTTDPYCVGDYLAAATYCSTDQHDRPTAALIHLCIGPDFFKKELINRNIVTVMHELGHSLGFNPQAMAHFRDLDGLPVTTRDKDGNVVERLVQCTGPRSNRRFANVTLPSERILKFSRVRGGIRVAQVVTPSVRQVVRNHFDCQTLKGAELESWDAVMVENETTSSCIGDHWERRLFRTDLMNSIVDDVTFSLRISPLTLALFADSGWYQVDLSRTAYSEAWGRGAGCSFVNSDCVSPSDGTISESNEPFFCNEVADTVLRGSMAHIQGCSPDMSRKAVCNIAKFKKNLPFEFQYFNKTFGANVGGNEPLLDYCPVYNGFSDGLCKDGASSLLLVSSVEEFGMRNSRCLSGQTWGQRTGLCLQIACVVDDKSLRVKVNGSWKKCEYTGQAFIIDDGTGTRVFCPDIIRACPTFFCDRDCLGTGGTCDFATGRCTCSDDSENVTSFLGCDEVDNNATGIFYTDPLLYGKTGTELAIEEDSPLADYYVYNERQLKNRRASQLLLIPYIVLGTLVLLLIASFSVFLYRRKIEDDVGASLDDDGNDGDNRPSSLPSGLSLRASKDKFVAAMLVHLRVHSSTQNNGSSGEGQSLPGNTAAETDSSVHDSLDDLASDSGASENSIGRRGGGDSTNTTDEPAQVIRRRFFNSSLV